MEQCIVCKKKVEDEEQGLKCDLCDQYVGVHGVCLVSGQTSKAMYEALTENRSKAVLYVCSLYHKQDSMSKHLFKFEMEYECTCKEWLVSACMLDEAHNQLQRAEA